MYSVGCVMQQYQERSIRIIYLIKNKVLKSNNNLTLLSDYFGQFGLAWELDSDNVEMKNNQF